MPKLVFEYSHRIFEYIRMIYTSMPNRPITMTYFVCIENMRYMYMQGIVSGLYQWRYVRKSTNFAQKTRQSGGV